MRKPFLALIAGFLAVGFVHGQTSAELPSADTPPLPIQTALGFSQSPGERIIILESAPARSRLWFDADYLHWWTTRSPIPVPLVTAGDPAQNFAGALGVQGTSVLLGNSNFGNRAFSGFRLATGVWLDPVQTWGVEFGAFLLPQRTFRQTIGSDAAGNPGIFLPLNDITVGEDAFTVAFPGGVGGNVTVSSSSRFWGAEAIFVRSAFQDNRRQVSFLAGFRHLNLEECIEIAKVVNDFGGILADPANPGNPEAPGTILASTDRFRTRNQFFGGQLGARAQLALTDRFTLDLRGSLAMGATHQILDINGITTQQQPGLAPTAFPTGILAGANNSGTFDHHRFSVVPEVDFKLRCQLTNSLHVFGGYHFLYWTNVIRPGNQISRTVDERTIPTAVTFTPGFQAPFPPTPSFNQSNFWAQGLVLGLEFRY